MNTFNKKGERGFTFSNINFGLNPQKLCSPNINYLHLTDKNAFSRLIAKPTRVTLNSQTIMFSQMTVSLS